ncbi:MAG: hypothetical protein ACE5KM_05535 [Planctomycetaceae bacterium]
MFRVEWLPTALEELAAIWATADESARTATTQAAHQVDTLLSNGPLNEGESRAGDYRIMYVPPLAIYYRVDLASRVVIVNQVWPMKRRQR